MTLANNTKAVSQFLDYCRAANNNSSDKRCEMQTELRFSNSNLLNLPRQLFSLNLKHITTICLENNGLTTLPEDIGFAFPNLKRLLLTGNTISSLPLRLGNLLNLQELVVRDNVLSSLPAEIKFLKRLEVLDLSQNKLTQIPVHIADEMVFLRTLKLNNNELTSLPSSFSKCEQLNVVDLCANQLQTLPDIFTALDLNLSRNEFAEIPPCVSKITNLEVLTMSNNQLRMLPENFSSVHSLRRLHLQHNYLKTLSSWIFEMKNIEDLSLFANPFCEDIFHDARWQNLGTLKKFNLSQENSESEGGVPSFGPNINDEFCYLKNLRELNLVQIGLKRLPSNIGDLLSLKELNISKNAIEKLPESICHLVKLEALVASSNKLQILPQDFGHLFALRTLILNENLLSDLPTTFAKLHLKYLDLFENCFDSFPMILNEVGGLALLSINKELVHDLDIFNPNLRDALERGDSCTRRHAKRHNNYEMDSSDEEFNDVTGTKQSYGSIGEENWDMPCNEEEDWDSEAFGGKWGEEDFILNASMKSGEEIALSKFNVKNGLTTGNGTANKIYCPADDHPAPFKCDFMPSSNIVQGQFDDAE